MLKRDFTIVKGQSKRIMVKIKNGPTFFSGDRVNFTAKRSADDSKEDDTAKIKKDIVAEGGELAFTFRLDAIDTDIDSGKYDYDIWADFRERGRAVLAGGVITVLPTITNRRMKQ